MPEPVRGGDHVRVRSPEPPLSAARSLAERNAVLEATMRFSVALGAALLLVGGVAQANEANIPALPEQLDAADMAVGIGVICNTTEQAEHFVDLRANGAEITLAVSEVNKKAQDQKACGLAAIAYRPDKTLETKTIQGKVVSIVQISVIAGYNGAQWMRVPSMVQYAIMENQGIAI
jgi:hypothetical protein